MYRCSAAASLTVSYPQAIFALRSFQPFLRFALTASCAHVQ